MPVIFHVGMPLMPGIAKALSKLGQYYFLDWTAYMEYGPGGRELLEKEILRATELLKPDITFLHVQRPGVITRDLASKLNNPINYTYDVALPVPDWYIEVGTYCTTVFCDMYSVSVLRDSGMRAEFALPGYDAELFVPTGSTGNYGDIVFLGNHYHKEQNFDNTDFRLKMVTRLKERYGDRFRVYGNGWNYNDGNLMFKEKQESECYRSCKIAINVSHFDLGRYTSDRMFRIMGSGAFCLSKTYPSMSEDFQDGVQMKGWNDFDELERQIDYYLINDNERMEIARAGNKYAMDTATWTVRMKQILELCTG